MLRGGDATAAQAEAHIGVLKEELKKEYSRERRQRLTQAIQNAEASGNSGELAAALAELNELREESQSPNAS